MSAVTCDRVRDRAPDFALGAVTGEDRATVLAHLDGCPSCRALVGEYAVVADALLDLVPEAEPAGDLAAPVLAALRPAPRRGRRRLATLAAAALVAISAATGVTWTLVSGGATSSGQHAALRSAPMVGANNLTVGRVVTTDDREPTLAVSVDYWLPDGEYRLAARNRAGEAAAIGTLVAGGRGTWTGSASAVKRPVAVTLADRSGAIVCEGRLG
jgi:hypothetical protein